MTVKELREILKEYPGDQRLAGSIALQHETATTNVIVFGDTDDNDRIVVISN